MPVIEVEHVTKEFRLGRQRSLKQGLVNLADRMRGRQSIAAAPFKALDDVSFSVEPGEVLGIVGHNGAGKSTLLKILAGISKPTYGRVAVRGKVAPLIEVGAGLVPDLTGRENIYINATILGMTRAEIARRFDEIVAFAELEEFIDTPVKRYSSGMQVRLGFSIATAVEADILIVDEVLAVGDLAFQRKCLDRMEDLIERQQRTVLIVGHNVRQIGRTSDRMLMMAGGRIVADGESDKVCQLFYQQSQRTVLERRLSRGAEIVPIVNSGDIDVTAVEILPSNGAPSAGELIFKQPATVHVGFRSRREVVGGEFHVGIHTPDFVYVFAASTNERGGQAVIRAGDNSVACTFGALALKPGPYYLRFGILGQNGQQLWYGEALSPFVVVPGGADLVGKPELWLVDQPVAWTFGDRDGLKSRSTIAST